MSAMFTEATELLYHLWIIYLVGNGGSIDRILDQHTKEKKKTNLI
jgi:phosphoribosyl-ATP pyrophosphohydrolase